MNKLLHMATAFVMLTGLGGAALAQNVRLPIPNDLINPTSRAQCNAMSQEWSEISKSISQQHSDCLETQACKNTTGGRDGAGKCSCGACLRLHLIMERYSSGDLAQIRKQRVDECNRKVAAHEANERQQRQAAQADERARQQAANRAAQDYADAQRQYADMQRRQREHQNAVTAQQLENQRRNVERLQQQQQRSQQALASLSAMLSGGSESGRSSSSSSSSSSMQPLPDRPQTVIGTTLYSASQMVNLAVQAKEDIGATMSAITLAFSSNPQSRAGAASNLADYAASRASDAAATGVTNTIVALMPRRNDHNDAGFSAFFEAAQNVTTGQASSPRGVQFIQSVAGGVLESQLQQTLGDMAQLERDINSFSAGSPSYYSTTRSLGGGSGGSGGGGSSFSPTRSGSGNSNTSAPAGNQDLAREEVEALRQGLRYAMTETRVTSPSLARFVGADNTVDNSRPATATCNDRARGVVADGRQICREGRALVCRAGQFQPAGSC